LNEQARTLGLKWIGHSSPMNIVYAKNYLQSYLILMNNFFLVAAAIYSAPNVVTIRPPATIRSVFSEENYHQFCSPPRQRRTAMFF
jgi:hypothetical protein